MHIHYRCVSGLRYMIDTKPDTHFTFTHFHMQLHVAAWETSLAPVNLCVHICVEDAAVFIAALRVTPGRERDDL